MQGKHGSATAHSNGPARGNTRDAPLFTKHDRPFGARFVIIAAPHLWQEISMKPSLRWVLAPTLALFGSAAWAEFHTYQIEKIFSNASGTVQYVVMHESAGASAEYFWAGNRITSTVPMSYTFPNDLPVTAPPPMCNPYYGCITAVMPAVASTADTRVLIATAGFAALGIVTPDYVVPNGFVPVGGGTINYAGVDQVTFGPLPTDGVTAIDRNGAKIPNVATNFAGQSAAVAPGLDLNQHGLTGSWYQAITSGQGAEVEVFPDLQAAGTGFGFVSWFTYDTSIGGADHQRWYTASGPVVSGQASASLTIYQNTGGNFVAPPITMAQQVGTATLAFDTCSSGTLKYNFADGRSGTIPLTRLTQNVTCSTTAARPANADFALSGNWYDAATSGQGMTVEVNPNNPTLFLAWYTYAPNGAAAGAAGQRWYTALPKTTFVPGSRSIDVQIFEDTGGLFDAVTTPLPQAVPVGTGTIAFQSCSAATFTYNFTGGTSAGLSGMINLTRVVPQKLPPGCA
jgi:hypothetical protein